MFRKNQRGSITLFILISALFFLVIFTTVGISLKNKDYKIASEIQKIKLSYETNVQNVSGIYEQKIYELYKKLPTAKGTRPYLPNDSSFYVVNEDTGLGYLAKTNLNDGLVISDEIDWTTGKSIGNEFVWIEVPSTFIDSDVTNGPNYSTVKDFAEGSDEYYANIEEALISYSGFSKTGTNLKTSRCDWVDEWYDGNGDNATISANVIDASGCGLTNDAYIRLKKKMLKSIYTNGGFWIGRYEAGTTSPRQEPTETVENVNVFSKKDVYPLNYVQTAQAYKLSTEMYDFDTQRISSLMFGVQWDLIMKHLENKGISSSNLKDDSSSWGNYYNSQFVLNSGKYSTASPYNVFKNYNTATANFVKRANNISTKLGSSVQGQCQTLLTTGASNINKVKNIYDLAGNVYEITLEHSDTMTSVRGGSFINNGGSGEEIDDTPASYRGKTSSIDTQAVESIGFRVSIF